jgi:carbon monoxide dehydrogenase subunit G
MAPFVIHRDTALPPAAAWARLTDWPRHGRGVPFTTVRLVSPANGPGARFTARTALGPVGFDDPMEVVEWDPPRRCRIEKRGRVLHGWAELSVEPAGTGSRVTWREEAVPPHFPDRLSPVAAFAGRVLFGRVLRKLVP